MSMSDSTRGFGWAGALPAKQGLYDPANERDSCGVGFIINIKGVPSHSILRDSEDLLCNMTHRGATGADERDGDGAGVMVAMPHKFMAKAFGELGCTLPPVGCYAVGNLFMHPDEGIRQASIAAVERIAESLGLRVMAWRSVPTNTEILGPNGLSREPKVMQPLVVAQEMDKRDKQDNDEEQEFQRRLFILRK
ncbi:glutamate synthase [NADH], partial [Coemansia sp. RSA 2618]